MISQTRLRGRLLMRSARQVPSATSAAVLAGVALAWSVLTVVFSVIFRPADCVSSSGLTGFVASNIAQMRSVADCPPGTLGYGPHTVAVVGAASALLAAALIGQVAGCFLAHWARRAARAVYLLITGLQRPLPRLHGCRPVAAAARVRDWGSTAVIPMFPSQPRWRRGPPLVL